MNLLGCVRGAFVADFDRRLSESEFSSLHLAHAANVLLHLGETPARAAHIVTVCGVSKQAVSQQISQLERNGYLTVAPHPTDQRARQIKVTPKGRRAQEFVQQTLHEIEEDWVASLGPGDGPRLRPILTALVARADLAEPDVED